MGRKQVRLATQAYIQNAAIPYVGTVWPARPSILQESAYTQDLMGQAIAQTDNGSSMVIVVNIPSDKRSRIALVGRGAVDDLSTHRMALELWFACSSGDGVQAQLDYDGIVDDLEALIRANANLGNPDVVWSAAEFDAGINHVQSQAFNSDEGGAIIIIGTLRFEAIENIVGTDV